MFPPVGYCGPGSFPQGGYGWQGCAVNDPVRLACSCQVCKEVMLELPSDLGDTVPL